MLMQKERGYVTIASAVLLHVSDGTGHTRNVTRKMGSLIGPHDARERGRMQGRTTLTWPPCVFLQSTDGPGRFHLYHCTKSPSRCGGRTTVRGSTASDPGVFWAVPSSPAIAARKSTRRLAFLCVLAICRRSDAVSREKLLTMGADGMQWLNLNEFLKDCVQLREIGSGTTSRHSVESSGVHSRGGPILTKLRS